MKPPYCTNPPPLLLKTHFTFNLLYLFFSFQAISVEPSLIFCLSIAVNIVTLPAVHAKKPLYPRIEPIRILNFSCANLTTVMKTVLYSFCLFIVAQFS